MAAPVSVKHTCSTPSVFWRTRRILLWILCMFPRKNSWTKWLIHSLWPDAEIPGKYRNISCLLIDDIHFLAGKDRTQEEFFTLSTRCTIRKNKSLSPAINSRRIFPIWKADCVRFWNGVNSRYSTPEIETKIAIIERKIQENKIELPNNVIHYIASHVESNIRELEGFLVRIGAYSSLTGGKLIWI